MHKDPPSLQITLQSHASSKSHDLAQADQRLTRRTMSDGVGTGLGVGYSYKFSRIGELGKIARFSKNLKKLVQVRLYELATS